MFNFKDPFVTREWWDMSISPDTTKALSKNGEEADETAGVKNSGLSCQHPYVSSQL